MIRNYCLFIDESGLADPKTYEFSPYFILSGCIVEEGKRDLIRKYLDQIKFVYWRKDWRKIIFRSYDIGQGKGPFEIFYTCSSQNDVKNPNKLFKKFSKDLKNLLKMNYFELLICLINKKDAVEQKIIKFKKGRKKMKYIWSQELVYTLSYRYLLQNFLLFLIARNAKGRINAEASHNQQDIILYKEFFSLQANGMDELKISHMDVKEKLTSLSFVTKLNRDVEEEIADVMGYAARLKYDLDYKKTSKDEFTPYDEAVYFAIKKRLLDISAANYKNIYKKKIARNINSFVVLPSKNEKTG